MRNILSKITAPIRAGAIALIITAYGQGLWGGLVIANLRVRPDIPWAAPTMAALLALLLIYLGGAGWPGKTATARRQLLRLNPIRFDVFVQALISGVFALVALGGLWLATSDLIHIPKGATPDVHGYPVATVISFFVMGCIAAPLTEEAAFRGYAQGLLQRAWGWAPAAIIGSSVLFAAAHFTQGLFLPKLGLYFVAGLIFAVVAHLTNSLLASIAVHSLGDVMGFLILWPHDATPHGMISQGGTDPVFWPAVAALVVFAPLALMAFRRLAEMTQGSRVEPALRVLKPFAA